MAKIGTVREVATDKLIPYANNAKVHTEDQVTKIASSIREFGFLSPVLIDKEYNIIAGHGRVLAANKLGLKKIPCVSVEGLTEAQRKAYILADNRLGELATWDTDLVKIELEGLEDMGFDIDLTGFDLSEGFDDVGPNWFDRENRNDDSYQEGNDEYNEFLDKFDASKTTDDCYTPDVVYDAVAYWVAKEYGIDRKDFVRPFYPGGDYQREKYKKNAVVVDNPPFSILAQIRDWYNEKGIKYFLFAPGVSGIRYGDTLIGCCCQITYENKAKVNTSFVTNLETCIVARTAPELYKRVEEAVDSFEEGLTRHFDKYEYPDAVLTAAKLGYFSKYGVEMEIKSADAAYIRELDSQKEAGRAIFGGAYLLSEKAAAEKAAALVWKLSDRELALQRTLGEKEPEKPEKGEAVE